ncbi:YifB family Mg chelatase-like AAA ATPase [candidate division WWE3 bacterium]|nr:YifB family Mg chelatase-like AAA ATPase [candidate division WWE3 bacterium]
MLVRVNSIILNGIDPVRVIVEVNITGRGFPSFDIVGMAGKSVQESKERVRSALIASGYDFPQKKVLVNLMPADLPKDGTCLDFPIAAGILACVYGYKLPKNALFYGELALGGELNYTKGCFNLGLMLLTQGEVTTVAFIPTKSVKEMEHLDGVLFFPTSNLKELGDFLEGKTTFSSRVGKLKGSSLTNTLQDKKICGQGKVMNLTKEIKSDFEIDIASIKGQKRAKRALLISLSGKHNILFIGSPGCGKTMLARSIPPLLPKLSYTDSLEVTRIYSGSGFMDGKYGLVEIPPFRSPHHTSSVAGIIGGGNRFKVGEISLAHKGILFLDELPEFSLQVLDALRQPLETKTISLIKSGYSVLVPTDFVLVATANPCPCGYFGDRSHKCICGLPQRQRYFSRISGPLLDRIDIVVPIFSSNEADFVNNFSSPIAPTSNQELDTTLKLQEVIAKVQSLQRDRMLGAEKHILGITVGIDNNKNKSKYYTLNKNIIKLLEQASTKFNLSIRSQTKVIKLARTIADVEEKVEIEVSHILEAISYQTSYLSFFPNS